MQHAASLLKPPRLPPRTLLWVQQPGADLACPTPLPLLGSLAAVRGGCRGRCRKRCSRRARGCWRACSAHTAICRPLFRARPGLGPCLTPLHSTDICEQSSLQCLDMSNTGGDILVMPCSLAGQLAKKFRMPSLLAMHLTPL